MIPGSPTNSAFHPRLARERRTLAAMTALYCRAKHAPALTESPTAAPCADCQGLLDYALARLAHCPFQPDKPTCAKCAVHCYQPEMRARVRAMMRYAGPRMLLRHPLLAVLHLLDGMRKPPVLKKRAAGD